MAAILTFPTDNRPPDPAPARAAAPGRVDPEIYRRRRLAVAAVVLGLVLGMLSLGRPADASRTAEARSADSVVYVVQPGDTLWKIASELAPGADPRPLVHELDTIAGGPLLQPGQRLVVPAHLVG